MTRVEPRKSVNAGIYWRKIAPTLVPTYEEHSARLERGISLHTWYDEMDEMERALVIACRRITNASENITSEAQTEAAEREAKRGRR